jgi:hypothetical protein
VLRHFSLLTNTQLLCLLLQEQPEQAVVLQTVLDELFSKVAQQQQQQQPGNGSSNSNAASTQYVCVSSSGINITPARVAAHPTPVRLHSSRSRDSSAVAAAAQQAAEKAAALNADAGNAQGYGMTAQVRLGRLFCHHYTS